MIKDFITSKKIFMLTQHHYNPSNKDIGEGSKIFDCCRIQPPDDPKCSDCCYDNWNDELKDVSARYTNTVEEVLQIQNRLTLVVDKRNRFKKWIDELNDAEEKARAISDQLEILANQSQKIWYSACKANEAIEILFCMIRDFYYQVDEIKKRYDSLQNCINNNTDPALVKDQGILKCLGEYYKKLEEVIKTRDELIKAVVEAIRLAQLIRNNISTRNCPCDDDNYDPCKKDKVCDCKEPGDFYGFKTIICDWYCAFHCNDTTRPCDDDEEVTKSKNQSAQQSNDSSNDPCKQEICHLKPCFDLPICNNSNYKKTISELYEKDSKCVTNLSDKLKDKNKEKEALDACKKSLESAIKEVNPKERCK